MSYTFNIELFRIIEFGIISFLYWQRIHRSWLLPKDLGVGIDHPFDILLPSHAEPPVLIPIEVASQVIRDRACTLQLEGILPFKSIRNCLRITRCYCKIVNISCNVLIVISPRLRIQMSPTDDIRTSQTSRLHGKFFFSSIFFINDGK